ncbi:MAG: hypothetical protein HZB67_01110 [Candidatus Aenigmarchaeota archaeon]|nr:hypothetical protein [Candidatus Aenigmarchaeota archaeon]
MTIVGFNMNSIKADVTDRVVKGDLDIGSIPTITGVEKKSVLEIDVLAISFKFETKYEPGIAIISMEGELLYKTDDTKKVLKKWKDDKQLPDDAAVEVLNIIFRRCLTKAVELSEDVGLPPPLSFPLVRTKEKE